MTKRNLHIHDSVKGTGIPGNMGMDHVGIVVPNAQLAADFFMDVFDAEFDWEVKREQRPSAGERGWDKLFGIHPDAYMPHVIMLKCGEHPLAQYIEIFEWKSPDQCLPKGENGWHKMSDLGNSYVSFTVKDMDKVVAHVREHVFPKYAGTRFIQDPPMQFPLRGEICTSTFLVSPWGMWIELTSWNKSKHKGVVIRAQRSIEKNKHVGVSVQSLPAPSFLIDLNAVDHNVRLMSQRIKGQGIAWRIPCKAHKCPDLAMYLLDQGGADGVVLLTLTEAESFARHGIDNIYLANQVGSDEEIERLSLLAKQVRLLRVAVDHPAYLKKLAAAIERWEIITPVEVLVELNVNHNRCGVDTIAAAVSLATLAKKIESQTGSIVFRGITGYEGHTPVLPPHEKSMETRRSHTILAQAREAIENAGIAVNVVSGGGSCNYPDCLEAGVLTEIQAGGGAVCDLLYYHKAGLKNHGHQIGALLLAQVISTAADQSRAIANAGFKSAGWHPFGGLPEPRDRKDLKVIGLSAEHTKIENNEHGLPVNLVHGDKLVLVPGYTDAMGLLHREIYAIRHDIVEYVWKTV